MRCRFVLAVHRRSKHRIPSLKGGGNSSSSFHLRCCCVFSSTSSSWAVTTGTNSSHAPLPTATPTKTSHRPVFHYSQIQHEIVQQWLRAEAVHNTSTANRSAQYCSFTYADGIKAYEASHASWHWLDRELSSNLAGETGAVSIYHGAQSALRVRSDSRVTTAALEFCHEHQSNEESHLRYMETLVHETKRTRLLPLWRWAGWTLGFVPTLIGGTRALYVTVVAVETFVEEHFQEQIVPLKEQGMTPELVRLLEHCCEDEVHHREDAAHKLLGLDNTNSELHSPVAWWVEPWSAIVKKGSAVAAEIARRV